MKRHTLALAFLASGLSAAPSVAALSAAALSLAAAPAAAQETPRRGLWGGFGFGAGSIDCESCADRTEGFAGFGVIGGTLSDVVRIGGGVNGFTRDDDGSQYNLGAGLFIVQVFPGRGNFFLQGGGGFSTVEIERSCRSPPGSRRRSPAIPSCSRSAWDLSGTSPSRLSP